MKKGKIVYTGTPEEVFTTERIRELFGIDTQINVNPVTKKPNIIFLPELANSGK